MQNSCYATHRLRTSDLEGLAAQEQAVSLPPPPNQEKPLGRQSAGVLASRASELRRGAAGPHSVRKGSAIQALGISTLLDDVGCLSWGLLWFFHTLLPREQRGFSAAGLPLGLFLGANFIRLCPVHGEKWRVGLSWLWEKGPARSQVMLP